MQATLLIVPGDDSEMVRCATVNESSTYDCWAETLATSTNTNTNTDDMEVAVRVIAGAATPRPTFRRGKCEMENKAPDDLFY